MEKRVTCPQCEQTMTVNIWSDTLTQVIRCSNCSKKFTHDPTKEEPPSEGEPAPAPPAKQSNGTISKIVGKGLRGSMRVAAAPVKMAHRGMRTITEKANEIGSTNLGGQGPGREAGGGGQEGPSQQPPDGLKRLVGSKDVNCPYCRNLFQAGLPDNDKDILTTQCPSCTKIFTFLRETPAERKGREMNEVRAREMEKAKVREMEEAKVRAMEETKVREMEETKVREMEEVKAREMEGDEDFAMPVQLKGSMDQDAGQTGVGHGITPPDDGFGAGIGTDDQGARGPGAGFEDQRPAAGPAIGARVPPGPPPWFRESSGEMGSNEWDGMELVGDGEKWPEPMGRLLSLMCPFCSESFGTPAPKKKKKVSCPICEEEFWINSHGELVAKKAMGSFSGGLAKIIGVEAMRNYQDTIRESMEGFEVLMDGEYLRERMKNRSGIAGFLLIVVALLGILYSGALLISIPGMGEDEARGDVTVTGNVIFDMDTLEGATVNITELGISNTTNSAGDFMFHDIRAGDHTLEISAPGKGTLVVSFTIGSKETKRGSKDLSGLVLPAEGKKNMDITEDRVERAGFVTGLFAVFIFVVSLLAIMGGLLALQGRRFNAAIFLGVMSVATIGFLIGSFLGILAVIFLMLGKKEFIS